MPWDKYESCVYHIPNDAKASPEGVCYLAGFDLDSTLILSSKGEKYSKGASDWIWAFPNIVGTMAEFRKLGWTIAIFSNRKGSPWGIKAAQSKLDKIMKAFGFEVWVFFATRSDKYRKPNTGMLQLFSHFAGVKQWGQGSFYCGDAAGPKAKSRWDIWSDVDIRLAQAASLTFYEPQERFAEFPTPDIDTKTNLIITVGQPGSGWDLFIPQVGTYIPIPGEPNPLTEGSSPAQRYVYVVDDIKTKGMRHPDSTKKNVVILVIGEFPSEALRQWAREMYQATYGVVPQTVAYWYARPSWDENLSDKAYPLNFQEPKVHFRIN